MTKKKKTLRKWLQKKFQMVIYHGNSYNVIRKFHFNRLGFILVSIATVTILFAILSVFVVYTPIKQLIPGYPDRETRILIYENAIRTDSLLAEIEIRDQYLKMITDMVFENVPIDQEYVVPVQNLTPEQIREFNNPAIARKKVEDKTSYSLSKNEAMPDLFPPIKGVVVSQYSPSKKHFGTDVASSGEEIISAVLSGTVIASDYTLDNGYTITIQHTLDLISVYKHVKSSFVKSGDLVETGQAIAVYGNSGENTSGPHLHFELWRKGLSLNPEDYIEFQ
ncbi:MAG TPA: M23 family metallopeptidase [Bacteroidales bacterium]|nr:M23 family metallopeptidase [Bacteroidales bacterium]